MEAFTRAVLDPVAEMVMGFGKRHQGAVIGTKDNIVKIKKMGTGFIRGTMETFTKAIIAKIADRDMEKCFG
jgi:hypothetical protein